ncbi:MAG: RagB/SusD family nutrient uptake outer membrane protein [Bacteroidota bacterium]
MLKFRKLNIFIFTAFLFLANACGDLEEEPIGILSPEGFFETPEDVLTSLNGSYSAITSEEFWGRKLTLALMLRSDMVTIGDPTTTAIRIQVDNFQMDPSNGMVDAFWFRGFEAIASANIAIEGAGLLEGQPEEVVNALEAEGRFLRAFVYYHFVRLFGEVPYIDYIFESAEEANTVMENTVDEVYAKIIEDLEYAKQWLPDDQGIRSRPTKGTAAGYLASVHLTRESWDQAYQEASFVITNSGRFGYELADDYQTIFNAEMVDDAQVSREFLFTVDFRGRDESSLTGFQNYTRDYLAPVTGPRGDERFANGEGWSVAVPTLEVFNSWDGRDYRKAVSFDTVTVMNGVTTPYTNWNMASRGVARPHIAKYFRYFGEAGLNGRDSDHNFPAMRYAEVLLIAAEALSEMNSGPTAEAESYIDMVRQRARRELDGDNANDSAFPANITTGLNQEAFLTEVMEERRLELAFEYKRWYDLVRRRMADEAFGMGGLEPNANFDQNRDYLMPKAQRDLALNDNLKQNTGY